MSGRAGRRRPPSCSAARAATARACLRALTQAAHPAAKQAALVALPRPAARQPAPQLLCWCPCAAKDGPSWAGAPPPLLLPPRPLLPRMRHGPALRGAVSRPTQRCAGWTTPRRPRQASRWTRPRGAGPGGPAMPLPAPSRRTSGRCCSSRPLRKAVQQPAPPGAPPAEAQGWGPPAAQPGGALLAGLAMPLRLVQAP